MSVGALNIAAAQLAAAMVVKYNIQFASIALLYYDYSLTWSREVQFFWLRKPTLSTALYFCCRYALISNVVYAFAIAGKIKFMSCDAAYQLCSVLCQIGRFSVLMVWGARTYAVCNRNKVVLGLLATTGIVVVVLSVIHIPTSTCGPAKPYPLGIPRQLLAIMTATFEIFAAVLTSVRICKTIRITRSEGPKRRGLAQLVLEQGTLYIGFVSLFSIGTLLLLNIKATTGTPFEKLLNALNIPVSGLMTCRFLLHLREWENKSVSAYSESRVLDSISTPLGFGEALQALEEVDESDNQSNWSDEVRRDTLLRNPDDLVLHITSQPVGPNRV